MFSKALTVVTFVLFATPVLFFIRGWFMLKNKYFWLSFIGLVPILYLLKIAVSFFAIFLTTTLSVWFLICFGQSLVIATSFVTMEELLEELGKKV
jgi:hypothetical protein